MSENTTNPEISLEKRLEALLFVATGPVTPAQLAEALHNDIQSVESALKSLQNSLEANRGISIQWHGGRVQLTSSADCASDVENFLGLEAIQRLSKAAIETLAIIAYKQPISRPGIDSIRGVSSDGVIKNMLNKGLIQEVGRGEGPGRPILFSTTAEFLQHFGLPSLEQLPPYELPETEEVDNRSTILKD
jgi:segregation and condensation protein B